MFTCKWTYPVYFPRSVKQASFLLIYLISFIAFALYWHHLIKLLNVVVLIITYKSNGKKTVDFFQSCKTMHIFFFLSNGSYRSGHGDVFLNTHMRHLSPFHKSLFLTNLSRSIQYHVNNAWIPGSTSIVFTYTSKACTVCRFALHLYCFPVYLKWEC